MEKGRDYYIFPIKFPTLYIDPNDAIDKAKGMIKEYMEAKNLPDYAEKDCTYTVIGRELDQDNMHYIYKIKMICGETVVVENTFMKDINSV